MNEPKKAPFLQPGGFFVFRTPLLPVDDFFNWGTPLPNSTAPASREILTQRLKEMLQRPAIANAIQVASPSLSDSISIWLESPLTERGQKIERALVSYLSRMCWRTTPFGLFAGISWGKLGGETKLALPPQSAYSKRTRIDMGYLGPLSRKLAALPEIRSNCTFRANRTLCRVRDKITFIEIREDGQARENVSASIEYTPYIERVLSRAGAGTSVAALVADLIDFEPELPKEEAEQFIEELINNQVLEPNFGPHLTGDDPLSSLLDDLAAIPGASSWHQPLQQVHQELKKSDSSGVVFDRAAVSKARDLLLGLPFEFQGTHLFQIDLSKPASATLADRTADRIRDTIGNLIKIGMGQLDPALDSFRDQFEARYEHQEVPLLQALDPDQGIGFGNSSIAPLLHGIRFDKKGGEAPSSFSAKDAYLWRKLQDAYFKKAREITIDEADIRALAELSKDLPEAARTPPLSAVAWVELGTTVKNDGSTSVEIFFKTATAGACAPMGRFCHLSTELQTAVSQLATTEEKLLNGRLRAEIVHVPEDRAANVICRPVLGTYEIPFLARSGVAEEYQLPLTDLMLSVQNGRWVLRSRKLNREVVPYRSSYHVGTNDLPVYDFLSALYLQEHWADVRWRWGKAVGKNSRFLPRVRLNASTVISAAVWRVAYSQFSSAIATEGDERLRQLNKLREELDLPSQVFWVESDDQRLLVDFHNLLSVDNFLFQLKGEEVVFHEVFPPPEKLIAKGPEGIFTSELLIPFTRTVLETPSAARFTSPSPSGTEQQRTFPPGSEWLYLKIYAPSSVGDEVIREIAPLLRGYVAEKRLQRWFFIRFADPDVHLRLRVQGAAAVLLQNVLPGLLEQGQSLIDRTLSTRLQIDTYVRELERYGGAPAFPHVEELFYQDSDAVSQILEVCKEEPEEIRWKLAFVGMDLYLSALGFRADQKKDFAIKSQKIISTNLGVAGDFTKDIAAKYRSHRAELDGLLKGTSVEENGAAFSQGLAILHARSELIAPTIAHLRQLHDAGSLSSGYFDICHGLVHLQVNRMLATDPYPQELVLYSFLERFYASQSARGEKS